MPRDKTRLLQQLEFVVEIDRLKQILRRTVITDRSRHENSAEHSWHLAVMAILLEEYANEAIDLGRVLKMVLVHDLVEIDAGDTFCYDAEAHEDKAEREQKAADRLFGLLPENQASDFHSLWNEFEHRRTSEARFANALDRLQPMLNNLATGGYSWRRHGISRTQVLERNCPIAEGSRFLWSHMEELLQQAIEEGLLEA